MISYGTILTAFNQSQYLPSQLKINKSGVAHGLLWWWDLEMAPGVILSCAPSWAHPEGKLV